MLVQNAVEMGMNFSWVVVCGSWEVWGERTEMTRKRVGEDATQDFRLLGKVRRFLIENSGRMKPRRRTAERMEMQKRADEVLLAFRTARRAATVAGMMGENGSWLRMVRQAVGVPVDSVARRLGVTKHEVFRLETAERSGRIVLATLKRTAEAMGCEVVYALVPRKGSLADLAAAERAEQEREREKIKELEEKRVGDIEERIGWRKSLRRMIRHEFRKEGIRVR